MPVEPVEHVEPVPTPVEGPEICTTTIPTPPIPTSPAPTYAPVYTSTAPRVLTENSGAYVYFGPLLTIFGDELVAVKAIAKRLDGDLRLIYQVGDKIEDKF